MPASESSPRTKIRDYRLRDHSWRYVTHCVTAPIRTSGWGVVIPPGLCPVETLGAVRNRVRSEPRMVLPRQNRYAVEPTSLIFKGVKPCQIDSKVGIRIDFEVDQGGANVACFSAVRQLVNQVFDDLLNQQIINPLPKEFKMLPLST